MGNGSYDHNPHHLHHQNFHHRNPNSTINPTTTFLPMLCRVSIKDAVNQPRRICPKKDDPSSPKVSCIGQVKKRHNTTTTNNRLINPFPTPFNAAVSATKSASTAKHSKLRNIFSGKNLLTTTATASTTSCRISTSKETIDRRRPPGYITACSEIRHHGHDNSAAVVPLNLNLAELDPPLPVVKRVAKPCGAGEEVVSLWKRRSGGAGLKVLQIQPFQLQNSNNNNTSHFLSPLFN